MFLLVCLASSGYIPLRQSKVFAYDTIKNASDISYLSESHDRLFVLGANPSNVMNQYLLSTLIHSQHIYPDVQFALATAKAAKQWLNESYPLAPFLIIVEKQVVTAVIGPIESEATLMNLIDLHVTEARAPISNTTIFMQRLYAAPTTIVTLPDNFSKGLFFARATGKALGPVNVLTVTPSIAEEFGIKDGECGVFRKIDKFFETFPCTQWNLISHGRPTFTVSNRKTTFLDCDQVIFRSNYWLTNATVFEMLIDLGGRYPEYRFVLVDEIPEIRAYFPHLDDPWASFVVANFGEKSYYDTSDYVTPDMVNESTMDMRIWGRQIAAALDDIKSGKVPKRWMSEDEAAESYTDLTRVVGSTYDAAISNETADVLMLFSRPKCVKCQAVQRKMSALREKVNNSDYAFAIIDQKYNQVEGGLPVAAAPCVIMWTRGKRDVWVLPLERYELIVWMTQKYGTRPHRVVANLTGWAKMDKVESRAEELAGWLKPEFASRLRATVRDLRADVKAANRKMDVGEDL
jgi:hypothetical protein